MSNVLELRTISRHFMVGEQKLIVLDALNLSIKPGEVVALMGPSGCGKTTLLQIAGLLDQPDSGQVIIAGESAEQVDDARRTRLRREHIGFVYQFHQLLPDLNAVENIAMPMWLAGKARGAALERAEMLLALMQLSDRATHKPGELSGGQQQRIAIARALALQPALLLADEPTGNLDSATGEQVFTALRTVLAEHTTSALIATHNAELAQRCDRVITLA